MQKQGEEILRFTVDDTEIAAPAGASVLHAALEAGLEIPHLCFDQGLNHERNCGLCCVEIHGEREAVYACETPVRAGMRVQSQSEALTRLRRAALEKLLQNHKGDCLPPCRLACPAGSDCQGYAGLIAEGKPEEALRRLYDAYPLPASLGRVCPHPCEDACRRSLFEGPVALGALKRFAADAALGEIEALLSPPQAATGKRVAVVGSGPAGLTAAWFLRRSGHGVTVFEAREKAGGMLRYGIPQFRLPKEVLDREIQIIQNSGVHFRYGRRLGRDFGLEGLRAEYDAVFLAPGAQQGAALGIEGQDLPGVYDGVRFLRQVAGGKVPELGKNVAVVGGGNTAVDACRTALRLPGVETVVLLYRRERGQMPAYRDEVEEAEREGAVLRFLVAPTALRAEGKKLCLRLQAMRLDKADSSGRQRPEPLPGQGEDLLVDSVLVAIGQRLETEAFSGLPMNGQNTLRSENGALPGLPGVFAGGDAEGEGPGLAVEACAAGKRAAAAMDVFLAGGCQPPAKAPLYVAKTGLCAADYPEVLPEARAELPLLPPQERRAGFAESCLGLGREAARREAARCLECGCTDLWDCKLLRYGREYGLEAPPAAAQPFAAEDRSNPYIQYDENKCVLCGSCARVCAAYMGFYEWPVSGQGFAKEAEDPGAVWPLKAQTCIGCGSCVLHCPTGALQERNPRQKPLALPAQAQRSVCNYCGVGCSVEIRHYGQQPLTVRPVRGGNLEEALLCRHGRFGWHTALSDPAVTSPLVRREGELRPAAWEEAYRCATGELLAVQERYGPGSVGLMVADRMTNEEIFLSRKLGQALLQKPQLYSANIYTGGLEEVFGLDGSTNSYRELAQTDCIWVIGADVPSYYAMLAVPIRQAKAKGARLLLAAAPGWNGFLHSADRVAELEDDTGFLKEVLKAVLEQGDAVQRASGLEGLQSSLAGVEPGEEARAFAREYTQVENAMLVLDRERATAETARLAAALAVVSGHIGKPCNGVIQLLQHNNTQAVALLGVQKKMPHLEADIRSRKIKGMVLIEQFLPDELTQMLDCVVSLDSMRSGAMAHAKVWLPMPGYGACSGSYTSAEGRVQHLQQVFAPPAGRDGWEVLGGWIESLTPGGGFARLSGVQAALARQFPLYAPCLLEKAEFLAGGPVRYGEAYAHSDGLAHLQPAQEKAKLFGQMVFADMPLVTWFGQLVQEGLLQY